MRRNHAHLFAQRSEVGVAWQTHTGVYIMCIAGYELVRDMYFCDLAGSKFFLFY